MTPNDASATTSELTINVERREADNELKLAKSDLDAQIRNVVRTESAEKLLARFEEAKREVARQREVLNFLAGALPPNWDSVRFLPETGADDEWRTALLELSENPDAELPE